MSVCVCVCVEPLLLIEVTAGAFPSASAAFSACYK